MRNNHFSVAAAAVCVVCAWTVPAAAQVRDGPYRGTLICSALPFAKGTARSAIEVTITGNAAQYKRPVLSTEHGSVLGTETGSGAVEGQAIKLSGAWRGEKDSFAASYAGTFVRRSAKLTGTQTWMHEGKSYTRTCSGAIKRPLALFLNPGSAR